MTTVWHATGAGLTALCGATSFHLINRRYAGLELDYGRWCRRCLRLAGERGRIPPAAAAPRRGGTRQEPEK